MEIFWTVSLKVHACFDGPEYWMNAICLEKLWNTAFCRGLYDKNSASYTLLSPQMWCLKKKTKGCFACTRIYWQGFAKQTCRMQKIRPDLFSMPYLLWSTAIIALKCERRLFFGCTYIRLYQLDARFVSLQKHLAFPTKVTWMCP